MFGRWLKPAAASSEPEGAEQITHLVREHLRSVDDETVRVVAAIASLLGAVAYADRNYSETEERHVREALGRVQGMTAAGIDAICAALRRHVVELSTVQIPRAARALRELGDRELRLEVLDALLDLAAADRDLSSSETGMLRTITTALGLSADDYLASQTRHRELLSVLKPSP